MICRWSYMNSGLSLTMLGTGHGTATKCYNTCFVLAENNEYFLVDAGGGNQILRLLEEQNIGLHQIHHMFVTHAHSDHILGAVWIIRMAGQLMLKNKYMGNLKIYANADVIEKLQILCNMVLMTKITDLLGKRIDFVLLRDGDTYAILDKKVVFFDIKAKKLLQYGFEIPEAGIVFCGDEPLRSVHYEKVKGCSYLLHEAFCLDSECDKFKPHEKQHSTVKDVCLLAQELKVKNLILMHTEDSHIKERKELYTKEGKEFFSGNLYVPDDGERIVLNTKGCGSVNV